MFPYLSKPSVIDQIWKPSVEQAPNCPRCNSSNTKFCYFNNYSLTQPRYFCKGCRRYWTRGGSLRNVPIGGGCRKNRRAKSVRTSGTGHRPATGSGSINHARPLPNSIRPDLMLDDPVLGSPCPPPRGNSGTVPSVDMAGSDGSNIDLALLYSKFLSHCPENDPGIVGPEMPLELQGGNPFAVTESSDFQMIIQEHGVLDCQRPSDRIAEAELSNGLPSSSGNFSYCLDPSTTASRAGLLPAEEIVDEEIFWSNCPVVNPNFRWQTSQNQAFQSIREDHITPGFHSNPSWTAFDPLTYEAFPSRP